MNTVYRILIKTIIFLTTCNMVGTLFDKGCYFTFGCALLVICFYVYEFIDSILKFDNWGDSMIPNDNGFVVYGNKTNYHHNTNNTTVSYPSRFFKDDGIENIVKKFKVREDKIEVVDTTVKEVKRPIKKVETALTTKADKKKNKYEEVDFNKPTINPSEFNKELIMLVNDEKVNKNTCAIYDCIIGALKETNAATSMICTILQAIPYIDICNNQVIIYVNEKQIEGITLSKIKRKIITNINDKFENKFKTSFSELKYVSVFDYFNKNNAV